MLQYFDNVPAGMNEGYSSDSENEDVMQSQMSRSEASIRPADSDSKSSANHMPESVNEFFQSVRMNCFPEAEGMNIKVQPWRRFWGGPQPPAADGKLLVACPKNCLWGSGQGLGGF